MNYINLTTFAQLSEPEIRALNPNTSFPVPFVPPAGYALVFPAPQPAHNPVTQWVRADKPVLTTLGHYEQRWEVVTRFVDYTDSEGVLQTADKQIAAVVEAARLAAVPAEVTMRQARLALLSAGLLSNVNAAIASLPEPTKSAALIEWEYAAVVQRGSGLVPAMGAALGMSNLELDNLFVTAAGL